MKSLDDAIRAALTSCWRRRAERMRAEKKSPEAVEIVTGYDASGATGSEGGARWQVGSFKNERWTRDR